MAIIDPSGLLNGRRLRCCSDEARLYWPYFYVISNGNARLEIDCGVIAGKFWSFSSPLSETAVGHLIEEYSKNGLLYLYPAEGRLWGQWDTDEKYLPRHKSKADEKSPKPDAEKIATWKAGIQSSENTDLLNLAENYAKSREIVPCVGVGVGVGGGVGKHSRSSDSPNGKPKREAEPGSPEFEAHFALSNAEVPLFPGGRGASGSSSKNFSLSHVCG